MGHSLLRIVFELDPSAWHGTAEVDGLLRFAGLVKAAGHSTIRLWFARESDIDSVRRDLDVLGCDSERAFSRLVAVDVPPLVDYGGVRKFLDDLEIQGVLEFEEACLGQAHRLAMPE